MCQAKVRVGGLTPFPCPEYREKLVKPRDRVWLLSTLRLTLRANGLLSVAVKQRPKDNISKTTRRPLVHTINSPPKTLAFFNLHHFFLVVGRWSWICFMIFCLGVKMMTSIQEASNTGIFFFFPWGEETLVPYIALLPLGFIVQPLLWKTVAPLIGSTLKKPYGAPISLLWKVELWAVLL